MIRKQILIIVGILSLAIIGSFRFAQKNITGDARFLTYIVDPNKQDIHLYWKNDKKENFKSISNLKTWLDSRDKKLLFAMNAGMYMSDYSPQGLFIENGVTVKPLDTTSGNGNFYLKPNGIFFISTDNLPQVCTTTEFLASAKIKYATQSGPMLLVKGVIHPAFKEGSTNLNIRNGVGILPGNKIVFVMSKQEINFHDFASYFKSLGCKNALYLDGLVSRTYLPEQNWIQTDGNFGVIIGVTKTKGK